MMLGTQSKRLRYWKECSALRRLEGALPQKQREREQQNSLSERGSVEALKEDLH
jgi:hypothetical protein